MDKIRSPLMRYLWLKMDVPPQGMTIFYVCGVFLVVGLLLPFGLLHERYLRIKSNKIEGKIV